MRYFNDFKHAPRVDEPRKNPIMKKAATLFVSLFLMGYPGLCEESVPLISSVSVGAGYTLHDQITVVRVSARRDSQYKVFENSTGWLSGYYEASVGYWNRDEAEVGNVAFSPVFVYYFGSPDWKVQPYIEAGIGAALISETKIGDRNMTTAFQFEDRFGIGMRTKDIDLSFRYMHYSNASISLPNDGIDILIITVGYRF
jgi:lipid A 3-O-deacylase